VNELVGAGVAVASATLYDVGYVLEKQALVRLPPVGLSPTGVLKVARSSRRWLAGFTAMLAGLGLQVVALTLAPVSVVQPILAGGLIALAAAGSSILGERLSRRQIVALVLVLLAIIGVAASARNAPSLATAVPGGRFATLMLVMAALAALALRPGWSLVAGRGAEVRVGARPGGLLLAGLAGPALAAGVLYGAGAVAEKAVATRLVRHGMVSGALASLHTVYPWVFLVATLAGMVVFQAGLQRNPASLMASLTNVTSTVCALVGASMIFREAVLPSNWWSVIRAAAFLCVLAAVALVALEGDQVTGPAGQARPDHAVAP
jgi:multidrug transporter EmrE-like cation transporter